MKDLEFLGRTFLSNRNFLSKYIKILYVPMGEMVEFLSNCIIHNGKGFYSRLHKIKTTHKIFRFNEIL